MALVALLFGSITAPALAQNPTVSERVRAVKAYLEENQPVLRQYKWTETTIISVDGAEKSRTQLRCSYGADGTIRKVPVQPPAQKNKKLAMLNNSGKKDKQETPAYMQDAVKIIHMYLPLNPGGLQAVTDNSKLSFSETDPAKRGRLTIRDFVIRGDRVDLDLDLTNNRPVSLSINGFLTTDQDPFNMTVTFGTLYGSAVFARETVLTSKQKKLNIVVTTTDYHEITQE